MNRYFGYIGFRQAEIEVEPSVFESSIIEKRYIGDVYQTSINNDYKPNVGTNIQSTISILADPFINDNVSNIIYVTYNNSKWIVSSIAIETPRLKLTLGGLYNED